jgi:hypothetical protein
MKRPYVRANRTRSHVPLNLRRHMWQKRRRLIVVLLALGMIPANAAIHLLVSQLIPNPYKTSGDQVFKHTDMSPTIRAYEASDPGGFTDYFVLPTYDDVLHLAAMLRLPRVIRARHGHVTSRGEALLVTLMRLRCKQKWSQLAHHPIFRTTPGHRWSPTKMKEIFRATMIVLHSQHGARISWSQYCFSPASCARYANFLSTKLAINAHQDIFAIIDGTHRAQCRPQSRNAQKRQREFYNGWLHKHCLGFQSVMTPDGLFASLCGPYPGSRNDRQKLAASRLLPTLQQRCPNYRILGDAGYSHNPAGPLVRSIPGRPGPGTWQGRYNTALARAREAVEWPFGHVTATFRMLHDKSYMKCSTPVIAIYKNAAFLNNCLLCMGYGNREASEFFGGCQPPSLATYLA